MNANSQAGEGGEKPSDNLSLEEFLARRSQRDEETIHEPVAEEVTEDEETEEEPEVEEEPTDEATEDSDESADTDDEDEDEEKASQEIDLTTLTPEQIRELAERGKSRLLKRIGELTAKNHQLEENLKTAGEEKSRRPVVPSEQNPFRDIESLDDIESKHDELQRVVDTTDRILEDHDDYGPDDIIHSEDGKDYTKRQIRQANRNSRDALLKFLPARKDELIQREQLIIAEGQWNAAIPKDVPEVADEESEVAKMFKAMSEDRLIAQIRERVPEIGPQIGYLLAHAARSLTMKSKTVPKAAGKTPKVKPPGDPLGAAGASSKTPTGKRRAQEAYKKFEETGRVEDWERARIAKYMKP